MTDQPANIYVALAERFPTEDHATVNKGGGDQTYVPAEKVIERLNLTLGVAGWSFSIVREGFTDTEAWVLGRITATVEGVTLTREQYGNEPIVMGKQERPTMDLLKKAGTDSLKKCASLMGVAAYLYDADERREVQAEMREAKKPTPLRPSTSEPRPSTPARPVQPQPEPAPKEVTRARAMQDTPMTGTSRPQLIAALATNIRSQREAGADVRMPTGEQLKGLTDDDLQKMVTDTAAALAAS